MVSPEWFHAAVAAGDDPDDGCHPQEAQALREYHEGKTTAQQAAYDITRVITTSMVTTPDTDDRWRLWGLLTSAIEEWSPSEGSSIFPLLGEIQKLPDMIIRDDENRHSDPGHEVIWDELPGFGHLWADLFQTGAWRRQIKDRPDDMDLRRQFREDFAHLASCEARLVDENLGGIGIDWGYECLVNAFERKDAVPDIQFPMVAEWLKRLAGQMYKDALDGRESWAFRQNGLDLPIGGTTMSLERWQAWKDRLGRYVQDELPGSDSVSRGIKAMEDAESER